MKRKEEIEKAAFNYINSDAVSAENMQLAFGDFINGAEWADKTMIDKACEWLKEYGGDFGVPESESGRVYVDDLVYEFRKAMEE